MRPISALGQWQLEAVLQPSLELVGCSVGECGSNVLLFCIIIFIIHIYYICTYICIYYVCIYYIYGFKNMFKYIYFLKRSLGESAPCVGTVLYNCIY